MPKRRGQIGGERILKAQQKEVTEPGRRAAKSMTRYAFRDFVFKYPFLSLTIFRALSPSPLSLIRGDVKFPSPPPAGRLHALNRPMAVSSVKDQKQAMLQQPPACYEAASHLQYTRRAGSRQGGGNILAGFRLNLQTIGRPAVFAGEINGITASPPAAYSAAVFKARYSPGVIPSYFLKARTMVRTLA